MLCEYCDKEHDGSYASGRFCDRSCARGFSTRDKRQEINEKVSSKLKLQSHRPSIRRWTPEAMARANAKRAVTWSKKKEERITTLPWDELSLSDKKLRVLKEQNGKCVNGHKLIWMGKNLTPEFHHKDGNESNNDRNNVEMLCPNCHNITDNYMFKNRTHTTKSKLKISKSLLGV